MNVVLNWHPTVAHDLHESVPFLYASTGTGPYNDEYDPILIDELHTLAYQEITELTRRGLPGRLDARVLRRVGAELHGAVGRESAQLDRPLLRDLHITGRGLSHRCTSRPRPPSAEWDRANPPVNGVRWCIRSNINYQESALLDRAAVRRGQPGRRSWPTSSTKSSTWSSADDASAPYAFVIPRDQRHAGEAAALVNLFRAQGLGDPSSDGGFLRAGGAAARLKSAAT